MFVCRKPVEGLHFLIDVRGKLRQPFDKLKEREFAMSQS